MTVIGITGIIGSGKSTVSQILSELGYPVIDLDKIANSLIEEKGMVAQIRDLVGEDVLEGEKIQKKRLAKKVFSDENLMRRYEAIIHPLILKEMERRIDKLKRQGQRVVFVEAPLIYESGTEELFDKVIVVYAEEQDILKRMEGRGFEREDILMRLKRQIPIPQKEKMADFVIYNTSGLDELRIQVEELLLKIREWEGP